ncbi:ATP-binding protein [Nannocystis pusilla]|uniref:DNA polymerase III subunit n=1 Tax=Nannocystis pusilla TaxID=889268 RepID=UPI003DA411FE
MAGDPPPSPGAEAGSGLAGSGLVGVLGHAQAQTAVVRALGRGQLHHALVLVGPRGVGKATFARGLGCALLCPQRPGLGCGACPTCQRVLAGNHPNVDWLVPDSKAGLISVDAARACHVRQTHAPYEGRAYLVVVDPADALGEAAGNALLKTIEEPRPGVHFALLTTNLQGVLPTILSRSLPVRLGRLDDDIVRSIVDARVADAPRERHDMAVLLAEGSAGVALELASDPSLARSLELVKQAITAVRAGPPAIFGGDTHPLWQAWAVATAPSEAVPEDSPAEAEPEAPGAKKKKRPRRRPRPATTATSPPARRTPPRCSGPRCAAWSSCGSSTSASSCAAAPACPACRRRRTSPPAPWSPPSPPCSASAPASSAWATSA